jgi:LysM domain-containing protein
VDGPTGQLERRTLTPAVLASALFVAASAVFAITFVAGRGGLDMPVASRGAVAVASPEPTVAGPTEPPPTPVLTPPPATPAPTAAPPIPTVAPTVAPTPEPTIPTPSFDPNDPLLALPECPNHPGCFIYVIQRNDTMSGIVSRYLLSLTVVLALNPQVRDPAVIVTGTTLYLGRDPFVRLDPCPDEPACSLYVVVSGDSLAGIAARYGLTVEKIRKQNPGMPRPLFVGQVIELPHPA